MNNKKMENLKIKGENDIFFIPNITLNAQTGICEIAGESYLEETVIFYQKILDWLKQYMTQVKKSITFNFSLTYFNTNSSRSILSILKLLKTYKDNGGMVQVNWYYQDGDVDMLEEVEEYIVDTDLPISLIAYG